MTKILLVEDDPAMGALVEQGLSAEGYEVTLVTDGVQALIAAGAHEFGAAAIDVMLPSMSGFEICRQLRRSGNLVPVLMLTARDSVEDRVQGLDFGADDYLTKPFAFAELSARIRALVRRDAAAPRTNLRVGAIDMDTAAVRATVGGALVSLSTKEFAMLRLFLGRPGEVLTRDEILTEVWGTTRNIDRTIVDQYVRYLRRKLPVEKAGAELLTVRGSGYRLEAR